MKKKQSSEEQKPDAPSGDAPSQPPPGPVVSPPVSEGKEQPSGDAPSQPPQDDLSASVSSTLNSAPSPNEAAIQAAQERQTANDNEQPKPKRKYTPRGSKAQAPFIAPGQGPDAKKEGFRRAGRAMADTLILVGQTLGGEDWKPVLQQDASGAVLYDERNTLREAWADMAEEYEISKMPAWAGCAIATAAYVGPRLNAPSTVSRWAKLKIWWADRKAQKDKEAHKPDPAKKD